MKHPSNLIIVALMIAIVCIFITACAVIPEHDQHPTQFAVHGGYYEYQQFIEANK